MDDKRYVMTFEQFVLNEAECKKDAKKEDEETDENAALIAMAAKKAKDDMDEAAKTGQEAEEVPAVLYHAIKLEDAEAVKKEGLVPQDEENVFLTDTAKNAEKSTIEQDGDTEIKVLSIDAAKMIEDGLTFDTGLKTGWFAIPAVDSKYIK